MTETLAHGYSSEITENYPINTNMTGFRCTLYFKIILCVFVLLIEAASALEGLKRTIWKIHFSGVTTHRPPLIRNEPPYTEILLFISYLGLWYNICSQFSVCMVLLTSKCHRKDRTVTFLNLRKTIYLYAVPIPFYAVAFYPIGAGTQFYYPHANLSFVHV